MIKWRVMRGPADRLRELRAKRYATAVDAARAFGWNENSYKSHENGERGIRPHVAQKYAAAYGSTAAYILTGDDTRSATIQKVTSVPLRGIVAAGMFRPNDWVPEDTTTVPALVRNGIPPQKQYAVRVDGPSVNKRIADGSYAICADFDSYPGGAPPGGLVHVVHERANGEVEHTLKEIRFTSAGPTLFPVSNHPDHQEPLPLRAADEETIRIVGVVIGSFTLF